MGSGQGGRGGRAVAGLVPHRMRPPLSRVLGAAVIAERLVAPIISEIGNRRRALSPREGEVTAWAAHFSEPRRYPAKFPSSFQSSQFEPWIAALHLGQGRASTGTI